MTLQQLTDNDRDTLERQIRDWLETSRSKWEVFRSDMPRHVSLLQIEDSGLRRMCQAAIGSSGPVYTAIVYGAVRIQLSSGPTFCIGQHEPVEAQTPTAAMDEAEQLFWSDVARRLTEDGHDGRKLVARMGGSISKKTTSERSEPPEHTQEEMFEGGGK